MDFYKRLNYSIGNEDWSVESQALRVVPGDRVICVTASGDRPLHLLMTECAEILSIDMNQIQNYLLELKLIAIMQLDFEKYLAFLGCNACDQRVEIFTELKNHLSAPARDYWENNLKMIQRGIIYQGLVERLTAVAAKFLSVLHLKQKFEKLMSFTDIESQREYVKNEWDTVVLRTLFDVMLNTNILKYFINDPGLNAHVDKSIRPGRYIYHRMNHYLENHLARNSALLQLIFTGKVIPDAYFPYLTFEGYQKIRRDINRLTFQTDNIIERMQTLTNIDCFSLSDIASYMPQEIFEKLLNAILTAAKPGARFCLREFMTKRHIPEHLQAAFNRNVALEEKLEKEESNFVYRFFAGEIVK